MINELLLLPQCLRLERTKSEIKSFRLQLSQDRVKVFSSSFDDSFSTLLLFSSLTIISEGLLQDQTFSSLWLPQSCFIPLKFRADPHFFFPLKRKMLTSIYTGFLMCFFWADISKVLIFYFDFNYISFGLGRLLEIHLESTCR